MAIEVVPHEERWKDAVEAFNARMREGGSQYGFYVDPDPRWITKREGAKVWREYHLAVEDGEHVRAGYALKPHEWLIHGERKLVSDWQGPFSEGYYSRRYAALGLRLLRHMLAQYPLLYSWGHGGEEAPLVQMLRKLGWLLVETPFCVRVVRGRRFLLRNEYLRNTPQRRIALDALAHSGMGTLGITTLHAALRARSVLRARSSQWFRATAHEVDRFGSWADAVWDGAAPHYAAIGCRDADTMNSLVPVEHNHVMWSAPIRLRIERGTRTLGWAIVTDRQMRSHPMFGDCRVGCLADYLAEPGDAGEIIHAGFQYLRRRGVDLVVANQSDPRWVDAFAANGFVLVPNRRIFAASPKLKEALEPVDRTTERLFLTNMDGHGPMGF